MIPIILGQRSVYYKQADASFFPTSAYVLSQAATLYPLQIVECILSCVINYFSVGKAFVFKPSPQKNIAN
jgi:hypothetical protein